VTKEKTKQSTQYCNNINEANASHQSCKPIMYKHKLPNKSEVILNKGNRY
jgi:hypothetical protein